MKTSTWIKIIFVVIVICGFYWVINRSREDITITKVPNENFQQEVLESPIPVVVIFYNDELWNRKSVPLILAIKEIMKEEQYKDRVKFWRHIVADGSYDQATKSFDKDPLSKEVNIKWLPTVIVFKNGNIIKKLQGGGCTVEESKGRIEQEIRRILR